MTYILFATQQDLSSAGINFTTHAGSLKFEIALSNWSFSRPTNTLGLHLLISLLPAYTSIQETNTNDTTTFVLSAANVATATINLIRSCVVDNSTTERVSFSLNNTSTAGLLDLVILFPNFAKSIVYDPDFSVTLDVGGTNVGDGSSNLLPLLSLLVLLLVPAVMVLIGAIALGVLVSRKHRHQSRINRALTTAGV